MRPLTIRRLTQALGIGVAAFGVLPILAPRRFAALAGFAPPDHGTDEALYRSVGARDVALGIGILGAASGVGSGAGADGADGARGEGDRVALWVLARLLCDAGDAVALAVAIRRGERDPRLLALTGLAVVATGYSAVLLGLIRRQRPR